jgi:glycosyltransferase involved in cell wall biosynthesis
VRIALDAQLTVGTATGIGEYVRGLTAALRDLGVDAVALSEPRLDPWRFDRRVLWDQIVLPRRARASGADVLHCASGTMPLRSTLPAVATVHDVAWLRVQAHARFYARYYFGAFALARYRRAARIVVDSSFSRDELLAVLDGYDPGRVDVVYPGVAEEFFGIHRAPDRRTILVVGTVERRKNLETVLRALPRLDGARVVAVGPATPYRAHCETLAAALGVASRVDFRGYVTRGELLSLYATCAVVAMPSRYEGFGYAAAQALCAGAPCVVANVSALPEIVAGDAPSLEPDDVAGWSEALASALAGERDARALGVRPAAQARFGWSASARKMVEIYAASVRG